MYDRFNHWRDGGHHEGLIVRIGPRDLENRVGNCWMKDRLKVGDLAMAIRLSGDCFWEYQLIDHEAWTSAPGRSVMKRGYRLIPESNFGAYVLGTPIAIQPTARERHLMLAGDKIHLEADQVTFDTPPVVVTLTERIKQAFADILNPGHYDVFLDGSSLVETHQKGEPVACAARIEFNASPGDRTVVMNIYANRTFHIGSAAVGMTREAIHAYARAHQIIAKFDLQDLSP